MEGLFSDYEAIRKSGLFEPEYKAGLNRNLSNYIKEIKIKISGRSRRIGTMSARYRFTPRRNCDRIAAWLRSKPANSAAPTSPRRDPPPGSAHVAASGSLLPVRIAPPGLSGEPHRT